MLAHAFAGPVVLHLHMVHQLDVGRRIDVLLVLDLVEGQGLDRPEVLDVDLGRARGAQESIVAVTEHVDRAGLSVVVLPDADVVLAVVIVVAGGGRVAVHRLPVRRVGIVLRAEVDAEDFLHARRGVRVFDCQPTRAFKSDKRPTDGIRDDGRGREEVEGQAFAHQHELLLGHRAHRMLKLCGLRLVIGAFLRPFGDLGGEVLQVSDLALEVGQALRDAHVFGELALEADLDEADLAGQGAAHEAFHRRLEGQRRLAVHEVLEQDLLRPADLVHHLPVFDALPVILKDRLRLLDRRRGRGGDRRSSHRVDAHGRHGGRHGLPLRRHLDGHHQAVLRLVPEREVEPLGAARGGLGVLGVERGGLLGDMPPDDVDDIGVLGPVLGGAAPHELLVLPHPVEGFLALLPVGLDPLAQLLDERLVVRRLHGRLGLHRRGVVDRHGLPGVSVFVHQKPPNFIDRS